jgi:hypothetical protein
MAIRRVIVSDLSGEQIPDADKVQLAVLEHPEVAGKPVLLDLTATEVESTNQAGQGRGHF